jgi:hypothetical protein
MEKVKIKTVEITSANILRVSVGTNCPQGGDAGHGGRTYFKLENVAGTAMVVKVNDKEIDLSNDGKLEIILAGDTECETFFESLKFVVNVLENQLNETKQKVNERVIDI